MSLLAPPASLAPWFLPDWLLLVHTYDRARAVDPGVTPTSWWRSIEDNERVGGAPFSQHLIGTALDVLQGEEARAVWRAAGFTVIEYARHDHVQLYDPGYVRRLLGG